MALHVNIQKKNEIALWCEYKDGQGNSLARFKVRGAGYKPYQVSLERAHNQIASKGFDVGLANADDKLWHELLMEAAACHLIADWADVQFNEDNKVIDVPYNHENAIKLLNMGDIGVQIWGFIKKESERIQKEADSVHEDILGKSENSTTTQVDTQG